MRRSMRHAILGVSALFAAAAAEPADAMRRGAPKENESAESRPVGPPLMAVVSLGKQRITIYDADGWILRAPVSTGQPGLDTPAGIYSILEKEEEHYSNRYDDAYMPHMQRITWSGIALHGGALPGHPASHGCIRLPYEFAERLYGITKLGMRIIVARNDPRPVEIDHPALFQPKPVRSDLTAEALAGYWDLARPQKAALETAASAPDGPADEAKPVALRSIAAAKVEETSAAFRKANAAWASAARIARDAARVLREAEVLKNRATAQLAAAETARESADSPEAIQAADEEKAKANEMLAGAEKQLAAAKTDAEQKADAAARAREEANAAQAERAAALVASDQAERLVSPVSVFISRKTQRLYIRQAFQQVLESPVTIRDPDEPIGTHIYTAVGHTNDGASLKWNVVSMDAASEARQPGSNRKPRDGDGYNADPVSHARSTSAALDRIAIPDDIIDRISEVISPRSSLIISDEGMSIETGKGTDFVILMSGEPQGGIKRRRREPEVRYRYGPEARSRNEPDARYRYDHQYRPYGNTPSYAPWFFPGNPFYRW